MTNANWIQRVKPALLAALCCFLIGCSDQAREQPGEEIPAEFDLKIPEFEDTFVVPQLPDDLLGYAATDEPAEPFRFEYQFQSESLGFTIKANQLNERVICDITYDDGESHPIELYVNQYRVLVADLIIAAEATSNSENTIAATDQIVVQSVAKTHRLSQPRIHLSKNFTNWVVKHLQTEAQKQQFREALSK